MNNQFKATKKIEDKIDVATVRRTLAERIDCKATFNWNAATKTAQACSSPGAALIMRDGANNPITKSKTFKDGQQISGDWYAKARCPLGAEQSIVISLAKRAPNDGADFAKDPLAPQRLMEYREIFGPNTTPLCGELFAAYVANNADNCNSSTKPGFVKSVNIDSNPLAVECAYVQSDDILNDAVKSIDIGGNEVKYRNLNIDTVDGSKVIDLSLSGADVAHGTISGQHITDSSLTEDDILNESLTGAEIRNGTLTGQDIQDRSVVEADLAADSVTSLQIANGSISKDDIKDRTISGWDIETNAITWENMDKDSVNSRNILDGSIATIDLKNGSVNNDKIASDSVDSSKIANYSVGGIDLASNSVDSSKIVDRSIIGADVANATITLDHLNQSGCTTDQVIKWNGTKWACASAGGTVTMSRARYHSGKVNGRPFLRILSGAPGDIIVSGSGSLCGNTDLTGVSGVTGGGVNEYLVDPATCAQYLMLECDASKGLEVASCVGQNAHSSMTKIHMHANGCAFHPDTAGSGTITCLKTK